MLRTASYSEVRNNLKEILDEANQDHTVTIITRRDHEGSAGVLMSLADYNSMTETLELLSSRANAVHLYASMAQAEAGQTRTFDSVEDAVAAAEVERAKPKTKKITVSMFNDESGDRLSAQCVTALEGIFQTQTWDVIGGAQRLYLCNEHTRHRFSGGLVVNEVPIMRDFSPDFELHTTALAGGIAKGISHSFQIKRPAAKRRFFRLRSGKGGP